MKKTTIYLSLTVVFLLSTALFVAYNKYRISLEKAPHNAPEVLVDEDNIQEWKGIVFAPKYKTGFEDYLRDFESLVTEALSPLGINLIIFDMHWSNYRFSSIPAPRIKPSFGVVNAEDAKKLADVCRKNGIHVMVGMNFLTHQSYGQLLKAFPSYQWPGNEKLWDPLNPEVNKIAFKMADELIDSFGAEGFHVGLDEGWGFDAKKHPGAKDYSTAELFAKAVTEYHDHIVNEKRVEMMMWSDMLEGRYADAPVGDALSMIPKDIILASWEYDCHWKRYPGLGMLIEKILPVCPWDTKWPIKLADKGFRVMVSPWKNPRAAEELSKATSKIKSNKFKGILYTTWSDKVVSDLKDALLENRSKSTLDPTIVGIAESIKRTINTKTLND